MDISHTLEPKSDQLDAVELSSGPRTVTITDVTQGSAEQPVNIHLAEFPRPWRPSKGVRRILAAAWGTDTTAWHGKRATIYLETTVKYGGQAVGGVRVSALSGIDKPLTLPMIVTRKQIEQVKITPLPDTPHSAPAITPEQVAACSSVEELRVMWQAASPDVQQLIEQRVEEIQGQVTQMPAPEPDPETAA
ncbi:hypothetical protein [Acidipropionibacterium jensenii]|uniref:hypothetical protein n=1 Tax=Acidipropionibacterium jensenii TaxID=1749 RepID=UPI002647A38F|nr:hypothetical protein [Acidipropionibacterium jensenii]MDN5963016.1 hypothetical protein [Actinomyces sp.]MDN6485299.1 hypothetical protein [Bifidobacterium mongoliense]MDN6618022.1 hypothetical protein [Corynebacterium variabile]MDN6592022.1 hypothetical protein [Acidipropionibacterium jensenii]MDN6657830.1 hypothetical protein [Acidipropionibacterium jensenii]